MNTKDIQRKIASGEIKITYAKSTRIETLRPWVAKVLAAVGHPEAFVTDESMIGDFAVCVADKAKEADKVSKKLGVPVKAMSYVMDVANRLRLRQSS